MDLGELVSVNKALNTFNDSSNLSLVNARVAVKVATWHSHANAVRASVKMADWLTNRDSLTARLVARCNVFRVQRVQQQRSLCLQDEYAQLGLHQRQMVVAREVVLRCDEVAMVYAHTVLSLSANASQWPLFASLGNRSLGTTLFSDPLVRRGQLQFAKLAITHPLMQKMCALQLIKENTHSLFARRSVFERKGSKLLVTEVFLPEILENESLNY